MSTDAGGEPAAPPPAASVPAGGSAYESAPAPTSTFGAYDTGAYGASSGAYAAPPAPAAPSAFNVRPRPSRVSPERERLDVPSEEVSLHRPFRRAHAKTRRVFFFFVADKLTKNAARAPNEPQAPGSLSGGGEASVRVRELDDRERVLDARERDLARREAELAASGGPKRKNYPFPGFFVFTYHDINAEIPEEKRPAVRMAHYSFIVTFVALFWNFISATAAAFSFGAVSGWFMAVIYFGAGAPLAWYLWYRRVYSACKHDSALGFLWFFLVYLVHIGFLIYAFIGMDATEYSLTGLGNWGKAAKQSTPIGFMYLAGMVLFGLDILVSINAIRMVYAAFRGAGHTFKEAQEQAKRDAVRSAAQNAT